MTKETAQRISRKKLNEIDLDAAPGTSLPVTADARPAQLDRVMTVTGEEIDTIKLVFAGTRVAEDESLVRVVLEARRTVGQAWERAGRSFVEIGRALNHLDSTLHTREEKARLKAGFEKLFPFSDPIASQFRRVAQMVDDGRVPEDALPGSYSAAYQLALLEPEDFQEALRQGLVSPNASRAKIIAFRRERSHSGPIQIDLKGLQVERRQLEERRRRMLEELVRMRRRYHEIVRLLDE